MWHATWQAILQHPVFGTGAGQYFFVVHDKLGSFNHPHNVVLQILSSWGFAGATCYFALAGFVAWRAFLALRNPRSADAPALLVAGSLLTMSLYEGSLFHTYPTMMFALALGVILAPRRPQSNQIVAV
jgi:O-antigen ligase